MSALKPLTGKVFGRLTVLERTGTAPGNKVLWKCLCDCGNIKLVRGSDLLGSKISSCGCLKKETASSTGRMGIKDLTGKRFGRLVVTSLSSERSGGALMWNCLCDCGQSTTVARTSLLRGHTTSCGCINKEVLSARSKTQRGKNSPVYNHSMTDEERRISRKIEGYAAWRLAVWKRDNYTCQVCGKYGGRLNAHHLQSYRNFPGQRTELSNGVTLCHECHSMRVPGSFHRMFGSRDNTKEQFEKYKAYRLSKAG